MEPENGYRFPVRNPRVVAGAKGARLSLLAVPLILNSGQANAADLSDLLVSLDPTMGVWAGLAATTVALGAAFHYRNRLKTSEAENVRSAEVARKLAELLNASPDQFLCWDLAAGGEETSPGLASIVGLPTTESVRFSNICGLFGGADRARLEAAVEALHAGGEEFELTLDTPAGQTPIGQRTLCLRGAAIIDDDGTPATSVVWVRDETRNAVNNRCLRGQLAEARYLLDSLPVPVWQRGETLDLEYVNRAYADAVGADPSSSPESWPELAGGAGDPQGRNVARRAKGGEEQASETVHVVMGGARRLVQITETRLPGGNNIAGYALDLTETEDTKAELSRHIAGHEDVLHILGTAIAIYDADHKLRFFNNAFLRIWELDENWLRSAPTLGEILEALRESRRLPEQANFPEFKAERLRQFTSLMEPLEELIYLPDGSTYRSVIAPHPFGGLLLTWEDVSDTLALERSYNTLIAVQRETLNNLYEGIAVIGSDGRLHLSNPAFGSMWQMNEEELAASPHISDLVEQMREFIVQEADWPSQKEDIIVMLTDREGLTGRLERTDGSILDYATDPLPDGAMLLSYLDVSDSTRVERALRERNDALETADRLKSEFIANVSYELRTPLNTIIGFAEIMNGQYFGTLNDRQMEYSGGILESSQRLLSLINDILDLASIESGHLVLEPEPVNLHDLLSSVLTLTRERMRKKGLFLDFDCPIEIGSIMADGRRLKQALFNIMSNSVKFTPEGGSITVSARRTDSRVMLTFTDTGIGISDADQSHIFNKFERGTSKDARQAGAGVGLGLSLVRNFIELHGGQVELESEEGVGTKVTCVLPAREVTDIIPAEMKAL